jgi:hypothetical protein
MRRDAQEVSEARTVPWLHAGAVRAVAAGRVVAALCAGRVGRRRRRRRVQGGRTRRRSRCRCRRRRSTAAATTIRVGEGSCKSRIQGVCKSIHRKAGDACSHECCVAGASGIQVSWSHVTRTYQQAQRSRRPQPASEPTCFGKPCQRLPPSCCDGAVAQTGRLHDACSLLACGVPPRRRQRAFERTASGWRGHGRAAAKSRDTAALRTRTRCVAGACTVLLCTGRESVVGVRPRSCCRRRILRVAAYPQPRGVLFFGRLTHHCSTVGCGSRFHWLATTGPAPKWCAPWRAAA